jgi:acyl dehydratase
MAFSAGHLYFDDVEVGQEWESSTRTVTEVDIQRFAELSGDFNPIHMDEEFCKTTPYKGRIAHGLLVLSLGSGLGIQAPPMRTMAFLAIKEWSFLAPVYIGDTIRVKAKILDKQVRGKGRFGEITWQRQIINQNNQPVEQGIVLTLVEGRGKKKEPQNTP